MEGVRTPRVTYAYLVCLCHSRARSLAKVTTHSSRRYGLDPAPGDLGFVQDFLNTHSAGKDPAPDLLSGAALAARWLEATPAHFREPIAAHSDDAGLLALLELREQLRELIVRRDSPADGRIEPAVEPMTAPAVLELEQDGSTRLIAGGYGWDRVAASVLLAMHLARRDGTWERLKICRNPDCRTAFYDRSRNHSAVWHDVHVCGNAANLRASRARRRAAVDRPAQASSA